ncbi:MAG: hypothetical protein IKL79_00455 [Clostridia bacterium]|nr:hypothetical protein [Clostridia bacterium]
MPFIRITSNKEITKKDANFMTMELGVGIECIEGKTEAWLMLEFKGDALMAFGGSDAPCAMVEVDLFGAASEADKSAFTNSVCHIVNFVLDIPPERIYVRYLETDTWGYNHTNF